MDRKPSKDCHTLSSYCLLSYSSRATCFELGQRMGGGTVVEQVVHSMSLAWATHGNFQLGQVGRMMTRRGGLPVPCRQIRPLP